MIFLAIISAGLRDALRTAGQSDAIWCGADAVSLADYKTIAAAKTIAAGNVTRFVYELGNRALIDSAIGTIEEHHPGQAIWIEASPSG